MATRVDFYEPFTRSSRATPPPRVIPWVSFATNGLVRFNKAAIDMLGVRKNQRVMFGQNPDEPREWFVQVVAEGGWVLRDVVSGQTTRTCPPAFGFCSRDLLEQVQRSMPYAPRTETLRFKFEGLTELLADGRECWPLLTAPYWQRPEVEKPAPFKLRGVSFAVPGLLAISEETQRYDALPMPAEAEVAPLPRLQPTALAPAQLLMQAIVAAGYSTRTLAETVCISYQQLYRVLHSRAPLTASLVLAFEELGLGPAAYWLHLQTEWQLAQARQHPAPLISTRTGRPRTKAQACDA